MWPALGTLLVNDGSITAGQLEAALAEKDRDPAKRLGEILVEQGSASRRQIARVLAAQHELEYVELDESSVEPEVAGLLPESLARRYLAVPVRLLPDGFVPVAVADPTNVLFADELRLALGMPVRVAVAAQDAIESAIGRLHEDVIKIAEVDEEADDGATVLDMTADTPAVVFVNKAVARSLDIGASDIHFTPQLK